MKRRTTLALSVLALVGCGGGGGHDHTTATPSTLAGSYTGTFNETAPTANGLTGSISMTIASDGTISGTAQSSQYMNQGTIVSGSKIAEDGTITLNFSYPNGNETDKSTLSGTLTVGSGTAQTGTAAPITLTGTLTTTVSGTTTRFNTSLTQIVG